MESVGLLDVSAFCFFPIFSLECSFYKLKLKLKDTYQSCSCILQPSFKGEEIGQDCFFAW